MDNWFLPPRSASIGPRQSRLALVIGVTLVLGGIAATPYADLPLFPMPGYMTAFGSSMLVINILLALLLFSRGATERNGNIVRLGAAYFFVAVIFVPLIASFPGGLTEGSVIGGNTSSIWLWSYWHAGFGLGIIHYALSAQRPHAGPASLPMVVCVVIAAATVLTLSVTVWLPYMPQLHADQTAYFVGTDMVIPVGILVIDLLALYLVWSMKTESPEQLWLTVGMIAALFDVWLTAKGGHRFSLGWYAAKVGSLFTSLVVLLALFHGVTSLYRIAKEQADRDGLTGLYNRRHFDQMIDREWKRARREGTALSFLMIDVDEFKHFNDTYGHLEGDDCLRRIATALAHAVQRPGDLVARYGGEEFGVLLPLTDARGAADLAHHIRRAIRHEQIPHTGCATGLVTVSTGVATLYPDLLSHYEQLVRDADTALYRAKQSGRDRVEINKVEISLVA